MGIASTGFGQRKTSVGTYIGNGISHEIVLGFRTRRVKIYDDNNEFDIKHFDGMDKTRGIGRLQSGGNLAHRGIKLSIGGITITDTGFIIGDNEAVNKNGLTYYYEVI